MAFNPSLHTTTNKPIGLRGKPVDARTYFYDDGNTFRYRPYTSVQQVLDYLPLADDRRGNFEVIINTGGTIQSGGYINGGTNDVYWFKDGLDNGNLVLKVANVDLSAYYTAIQVDGKIQDLEDTLSSVATSGDYNDLFNKPTPVDTSGLQPKTDNALNTTSKTIVGSINEVKAKADSADAKATVAQEDIDALELILPTKANQTDLSTEITNRSFADNVSIANVSKLSPLIVYDDFDAPDRILHGSVSPTGQTWAVSGPGNLIASTKDGVLVNNNANFYASLQYGQPIKYIQGVISYLPNSSGTGVGTTSSQTVIIAQRSNRDLLTMLHAEFTFTGFSLKKRLNNPLSDPSNAIGGGSYKINADGTQYHCGMRIIKGSGSVDTVIIEAPDGREYTYTYDGIPTDELTCGTWQVQQTNTTTAVVGRWHHVAIGNKKIYKGAVLKGGTSPAEINRIAGYGFDKKDSKTFNVPASGWYRIAYNTSIQGFTLQGELTVSTIGLFPSHFVANIFARDGFTTRINQIVNYNGYHLTQVRVGVNTDSAYIDVYIANVEGNTVTLNIGAKGYINIFPLLNISPDVPALTTTINVATPQITTFSGSTALAGWNRIATQRSGAGGIVMYGLVKIKAIDSARFVNLELLISSKATSTLQPIQILSNTGGTSSPITQIRLSRNSATEEIALDINCPTANTELLNLEIEYVGTFTIPSEMAIGVTLPTEEQVLPLLVNRQNIRRVISYPDRDETIIHTSLSNGGSYTIGNNESLIWNISGAISTTTVVLPPAPVNGQSVSIASNSIINSLAVSPNSGQTLPTTILRLNANQIITFRYRGTNAQWYLADGKNSLTPIANASATAFTSTTLNTTYPSAKTGFVVYHTNLSTKWEKIDDSSTGTWISSPYNPAVAPNTPQTITVNTQGVVNTKYIVDGATLVTVTLPLEANVVVGDQVLIRGKGVGLWRLAQNGSQVIHGSSSDTTVGLTGYIQSTNRYDSVLVEKIATNEWSIIEGSITLTIV